MKIETIRWIGSLSALLAASCVSVNGGDLAPLPILSATASADDGNVAANTTDGSLATRWSAEGDGQWILYDLGSSASVGSVQIAFHKGDLRTTQFEIQTSDTGTNWTTVFSGTSSGTTAGFESFDAVDSVGRYVRIVGHGNSQSLWNSISEVRIFAPEQQFLIRSEFPSPSMVSLRWNSLTGVVYQVQVSSNFATWADLGPTITNAAATVTWDEDLSQVPAAARAARFYRVKQLPESSGPTNDAVLPSAVLALANWKLTLPVNTAHAGSPDEYLQPELDGFQDTNYFHVNGTHDAVVFKAPCGGATTSGSGYPRSELREMINNGSGQASWSTSSGTHTMEITQAITHLPDVKPHVVAGQIHDAGDDVVVFRLEGSKLFVDENGNDGPVLTPNYRLGDVFTVKFVARNGGVECYYNGQYVYTYTVAASGCYFKAGCYTQSNTSTGDAPTAYGEVVIYNVTVTHQ